MDIADRSRSGQQHAVIGSALSDTTRTSSPEIKALTSLRFFTALFVFAFHIHIRWSLTSNTDVSSVLSQGAIGMSIFFMLSGYVLAYRYSGPRFNTREYFENRFAKIYPIYIVAAVITLPWLILPGNTNPLLPGGVQLTLQLVVAIGAAIFLLQAWITPLFSLWNFGASWSVSVEAFLYSAFPLVRKSVQALTLRRLLGLVFVVYVLALVPGLVIAAFTPDTTRQLVAFYVLPIFRLSEFLLGMCAYRLTQLVKMRAAALDVAVIVLWTAVLLYLAKLGNVLPLWIVHDWIVLPTIFITLIALGSGTLLARFLALRPWPWLGRISYCFYSFQVFVIFLIYKYRDDLIGIFPAARSDAVLAVVALVFLLGISALGYHFIEEPLRKGIRNRLRSSRTKSEAQRAHVNRH